MLSMVRVGATRAAWNYLNDSVADDASQRHGQALDYYIKGGNPPGRWMGSGLDAIGMTDGAAPTKLQLERLFGNAVNPSDPDDQLGRKLTVQEKLVDRVNARLSDLPTGLSEDDRLAAHEQILQEEGAKPAGGSVAGFEFVFNPPKSVSAWWALADPALKEEIRSAHNAAMRHTLEVLERDVARTRVGTDGVAQVETKGILAVAFDHWETRERDPQLHTHVLVSNRVQGPDGKWRTLDSKHALSPSVVTLSTRYDAALRDELTTRFGVQWVEQTVHRRPEEWAAWLRNNGQDDSEQAQANFALSQHVERRNHKWEVAGVPMELLDAYSTRAKQVQDSKEALVAAYVAKHGRAPSTVTVLRMRAAAAIRTRRSKANLSLKGLTRQWRKTAAPIVGDTFAFAEQIAKTGSDRLDTINQWAWRADDLNRGHVDAAVGVVLHDLAKERATWRRSNAEAAAFRALAAVVFKSSDDRDQCVKFVVDQVLERAIALTPPAHMTTPTHFQTAEGASQFHPEMVNLYTTQQVWEAEAHLLAAAETITDLRLDPTVVDEVIARIAAGTQPLGVDQADALRAVAESGLALDVLVGPAGAGKTTTMKALRQAWEAGHGAGSVRGLAPTARAAEELAKSLGIPTENTQKWVFETTTKQTHSAEFHMRAGDLIVVDEASIGGTLAIDELARQAEQAGAKLLLVGDWAQLAAVDAGGAFGMIVRSRAEVAELAELWRFRADWEKAATLKLRFGEADVLEAYIEHERISWGYTEGLIHQVIDAWKIDESAGLESLLIAPTNELASELNDVARAWRISQGQVDGSQSTRIQTGEASVGDRIVTRANNRKLFTDTGKWVRNNDEWVVVAIHDGGSLLVADDGGDRLLLPADYVHESVQLAYACTAHRAQGRTVDTAHTIVDDTASRETFYVAMSRGKIANNAYVAIDPQETMEGLTENAVERSWQEILEHVLATTSAELSAHETGAAEDERIKSIAQLAAEYETIATVAHEEAISTALATVGLDADEFTQAETWPALQKELARFPDERITEVLTSAIGERDFTDARSSGAVLLFRLAQIKSNEARSTDRVAGILPLVRSSNDELDQALRERASAIEARAVDALVRDRAAGAEWLSSVAPSINTSEQEWAETLLAIAAWRERYQVSSDRPFGVEEGMAAKQRRLMLELKERLAGGDDTQPPPAGGSIIPPEPLIPARPHIRQ